MNKILWGLALMIPHFLFGQFQADPCLEKAPVRIVVLGSSTAAGTGASVSDSSWVNSYRSHLQGINPANEVINLARGGYVTYNLMPDQFVPPSNRPDPDTLRNIDHALSFNPDAIIVNLPSNDRRYPAMEQLNNFDSLFRYSNSNGVPIWIFTTQPIDIRNSSTINYQKEVRDSIMSWFSPFAIDVWTPLADSTGAIDTSYAADAVHLNNTGHRIIRNVVLTKNIPSFLYQPPNFVDVSMDSFEPVNVSACGDSSALFQAIVVNTGQPTAANVPVNLEFRPPGSSPISLQLSTQKALGTCEADTVFFRLNTYGGGTFSYQIFHQAASDSVRANDTLINTIDFTGHPSIQLVPDTGCIGNPVILDARTGATDTLLWYLQPQGGQPIHFGRNFQTPNLNQSQTYYVDGVRGKLQFDGSLATFDNANVRWNGTAFDLVALQDTLTLDSLGVKIFDTGLQGVEVFYKSGTYRGFEIDANAWTLLGKDTVQVTLQDSVYVIQVGGIRIMPGDTLGLHIRMENAASRLRYRSFGSTATFSSPELIISGGSGVSYNFGGSFHPRVWNGEVYYSYGERLTGDCNTGRQPIRAEILTPSLDLGQDTSVCDSFQLDGGQGFQYRWSTGDTVQFVTATQSGTYFLAISEPIRGCSTSDTINLTLIPSPQVSLGGDRVQCGGQLTLDAGLGPNSYAWNTGDTTNQLTVTQTGRYSVVVQNICGMATDTVEALFQSLPNLSFPDDTTACDSLLLLLSQEPATTYAWSTGDSTPSAWIRQSGPIWAEMTNTCGNAIDVMVVEIDSFPNADFSLIQSGPFISLTNTSSGGNSFSWTFGDGGSSNFSNPSYQYVQSGTYQIVLETTNTCGTDTTSQTIQVRLTGLNASDWTNYEIYIYPNPSSKYIHINSAKKVSDIQIHDLAGKEIRFTKTVEANITRLDPQTHQLPDGKYLLSFFVENKFFSEIIVLKP
ncbi:MAG: PKD domain-containing protein [Bacteroidota bacterium]